MLFSVLAFDLAASPPKRVTSGVEYETRKQHELKGTRILLLILIYNAPLGVLFIHIRSFLHDQNTLLTTLRLGHIPRFQGSFGPIDTGLPQVPPPLLDACPPSNLEGIRDHVSAGFPFTSRGSKNPLSASRSDAGCPRATSSPLSR